ncbi:hypothetical protein BK121_27810 [Paenibacillus odorifer]|uniref:hypothetical protein n=1 Tax=Paenibacillus odorifer TaxID=189426 RepID=UPI00096D84CD|nr:hypothetical protein [Paenibacillus odorifer]OMC63332.1 hypothetical protein BK121_27810 [Paenibacillus odorifer]
MIKNEFELEISNARLSDFLLTNNKFDEDPSITELSPRKQEIYRTAINGEIESLKSQIDEYKLLKSGELGLLRVFQTIDLPKVLIGYRIAKGYTELGLATILGITESEMIEYEENLFADADPKLISQIIKVLGIEVPNSLMNILMEKYDIVSANLKNSIRAIYESVLPTELKENYNLTDGYLKLHTTIERMFGDQSEAILNGESVRFNQLATVRYKVPKSAKEELVYAYTSYASHIANIVSSTINSPQFSLTTDGYDFKKKIVEKYGEFNFENCVNFIWDLGIPVIPLTVKGGFHGACWRYKGRNVIVLKQQSNSSAKWMFDLLHEYWHATQDPELLEREVVDISETLLRLNDDKEEIEANDFANNVIFDGKSEEILTQCYTVSGGKIANLKKSVITVARFNNVDVSSLANLVAYDVSANGNNWWGAAQNLQLADNPYTIVFDILEQRLRVNEINDYVDRDLILKTFFGD